MSQLKQVKQDFEAAATGIAEFANEGAKKLLAAIEAKTGNDKQAALNFLKAGVETVVRDVTKASKQEKVQEAGFRPKK